LRIAVLSAVCLVPVVYGVKNEIDLVPKTLKCLCYSITLTVLCDIGDLADLKDGEELRMGAFLEIVSFLRGTGDTDLFRWSRGDLDLDLLISVRTPNRDLTLAEPPPVFCKNHKFTTLTIYNLFCNSTVNK